MKSQEEIIDYFEGLDPEIKAELGIKGLTREEAFQKLYDNHPELPKEAIDNTIINGDDLEF